MACITSRSWISCKSSLADAACCRAPSTRTAGVSTISRIHSRSKVGAAASPYGEAGHDPVKQRAQGGLRPIVAGIATQDLVDRGDNRVDAVGFLFPAVGLHRERLVDEAADILPCVAPRFELDDLRRFLEEMLHDQIALASFCFTVASTFADREEGRAAKTVINAVGPAVPSPSGVT